jgi:hypothetical protein
MSDSTLTPNAAAIGALEVHVKSLQKAVDAFKDWPAVDNAVHDLRFEASWALGYLQAELEERRKHVG